MSAGIHDWCSIYSSRLDQTMSSCMRSYHELLLNEYWHQIWKNFALANDYLTISDLQNWARAVFLIPGNLLIYSVASSTTLHDFFEISEASFSGTAAGVFSFIAFLFLYISVSASLD